MSNYICEKCGNPVIDKGHNDCYCHHCENNENRRCIKGNRYKMKINYKGFKSLLAICKYFNWDYNLVKQKLAVGLTIEQIEKEFKQEKIRIKRQKYFNEYYKKVLKEKRKNRLEVFNF